MEQYSAAASTGEAKPTKKPETPLKKGGRTKSVESAPSPASLPSTAKSSERVGPQAVAGKTSGFSCVAHQHSFNISNTKLFIIYNISCVRDLFRTQCAQNRNLFKTKVWYEPGNSCGFAPPTTFGQLTTWPHVHQKFESGGGTLLLDSLANAFIVCLLRRCGVCPTLRKDDRASPPNTQGKVRMISWTQWACKISRPMSRASWTPSGRGPSKRAVLETIMYNMSTSVKR